MSQSLYQFNIESLQKYHPDLQLGDNQYQPILRDDGYFYATIPRGHDFYTISKKENIALDLHTFRQEIHNSAQQEVDLFFLLGIGLGYRLRAISETLPAFPQTQIVVLEENPSMLNLACHCSDLRERFASPQIAWIITPELQHRTEQAIKQKSWFGANRSVFFWGYQTHEQAFQPDYATLAETINQFIQQSLRDFAQNWKDWLHQLIQSPSNRIAMIYPDTLSPHQIEILRKQHSPHAEIVFPTKDFCSNTYLMQKIMQANANRLLWINLDPGTGIPREVFENMPLKNERIRMKNMD